MEEQKELSAIQIADLISKYLAKELTEAEELKLAAWMSESDANSQVMQELYDESEGSRGALLAKLRQYDGAAALERFTSKTEATVIDMPQRHKRGRIYAFISSAAAVLLIATLVYLNSEALHNWISPVKYQRLSTIIGERKTITLTDGSVIWLSPASTVEYPENFRGNTREVTLRGEAFFEVAKDKTHPFIVHAGELNTQVLGTSFNIRAYPELKDISVTLLTGKVSVGTSDKGSTKAMLQPNQRAVFNRQDHTLKQENYPQASDLLGRRSGLYTYKGTPVQEIILDMAREYNIPIRIEGDLAACVFYGKKKPEDDVFAFLRNVCIAINAQIETDGNVIIIRTRGC